MKWLIEILKKRSWKVYAFMFGLFLFSFLFSFLLSSYILETEEEKVKEIINQIESNPEIIRIKYFLDQRKYFNVALLIFFHNTKIALINYFFGIGFLIAILIQISNGFLVGFLTGITTEIFSGFIEISGFILVMILEIIAITLTAVEGMYLTYTFLRPEKMWKTKSKIKAVKKTFSQSLKIILFSLSLLLIAATIETLIIYYQVSLNLRTILLGV